MTRRLDRVGVVLAVLVCGWTLVAARTPGSRPLPVLGAVALCVGMFVAGRVLAQRHPALPGALAATAVGGAVAITWPGLTSPGGGPLGYGNANAVLCGLGAVAAVSAAASLPRLSDRVPALAVAAALAVGIAIAGSLGAALALAVPLGSLAVLHPRRQTRIIVPVGAVAVCLALLLTTGAGLRADDLDLDDTLERRAQLWSAAVDLIREDPFDGVGPGRFAAENAASADPDLRWAHHGFLQQGAEQGVIGLVLLLGLVSWGYARLWMAQDGSVGPALGAVALTLTALAATVDHVIDEPAVTAVTALLVGAATLAPPGPSRAGGGAPPSVPSRVQGRRWGYAHHRRARE